MLKRGFYILGAAVIASSFFYVLLRGEVQCGMDDDYCWNTRGWAPMWGGIAVAAVLFYVGRVLDRRPKNRQ